VLSKACNLSGFTELCVIIPALRVIVEVTHQEGRGLRQPSGQMVAVECTVLQINKKFAPEGCSPALSWAPGQPLPGPAQALEEPCPFP